MRTRPWLPLILLLAGASPALGLTPRLVKDINTLTLPLSSSPESFVPTQSLVYSGLADGSSGLWKSDGTEAGTVQLLSEDGAPFEFPQSFRVFNGRIFSTTWAG